MKKKHPGPHIVAKLRQADALIGQWVCIGVRTIAVNLAYVAPPKFAAVTLTLAENVRTPLRDMDLPNPRHLRIVIL